MNQEFKDLPALLAFVAASPASTTKGYCRLGWLGQAGEQAAALLGAANQLFALLLDSDGIRHTLAQHGLARQQAEALRNQIPIEDADFLALPEWLPDAQTIRAGLYKPGKQPRLEIDRPTPTEVTTVIVEWRPGRQQLAVVTMYNKRLTT